MVKEKKRRMTKEEKQRLIEEILNTEIRYGVTAGRIKKKNN